MNAFLFFRFRQTHYNLFKHVMSLTPIQCKQWDFLPLPYPERWSNRYVAKFLCFKILSRGVLMKRWKTESVFIFSAVAGARKNRRKQFLMSSVDILEGTKHYYAWILKYFVNEKINSFTTVSTKRKFYLSKECCDSLFWKIIFKRNNFNSLLVQRHIIVANNNCENITLYLQRRNCGSTKEDLGSLKKQPKRI